MKRLALIALFLLAGCYGPGGNGPAPTPIEPGSALVSAAKNFAPAYSRNMAQAARDTAAECDSFKGWDEFKAAYTAANAKARTDAAHEFEDELGKVLGSGTVQPWDAAKAKAALAEAADGFERGAGK